MKELLIELKNSKHTNQPKYQRLAEGIRQAIRNGKVIPGEILPSTRELSHVFKINRHTVMRAFAELVAEGWLIATEKKFYQVTPKLPTDFLKPQKFSVTSNNIFTRKKMKFANNVLLEYSDNKVKPKYSFPSGFPDIREFPMSEFKSHMYDALRNKKNLSYGHPSGSVDLINQIKIYLRRIRGVADRDIIVTNGSQEAIFLIAQLLIKSGDGVAVEALGYPPAIEALRFAGAKLIPIAVDKEGLVVEDLRKQLKKNKIRMIYSTPLHQYPTTVTLTAKRRLELYELCYDNNILILEDDYDHEFHYVSQPVAPLAANDPGGIVLYVSTFSKILFPSARVGFMAVPCELAKEVNKLKRISSRQNEQIIQDGISRWMESGGFEKHLRKMRRLYEERRSNMLEDLVNIKKNIFSDLSWDTPPGGMAFWLNLNQDSSKISEIARQNKIFINPESNYQLDIKAGTHLRIGFSGQTPQENRAGLLALFDLIKKSKG